MGPRLLHYSDVENAFDEPSKVGRLAGLLRDLDGPDAVVAGAGDDTSPGVLALVEEGRQALPFFEAAGTDVEAFGNHDFDYGPAATRRLVADSPQTWLGANVWPDGVAPDEGDGTAADAERFAAAEGAEPWTTVAVDGATVGVVGLTDPATASINPAAAVSFSDPLAAAREAVEALRAAGAEHLVALSHLGAGDDELARELPLDAVLGGHVHSERCEVVAGTPVLRPDAGGDVVWELDLDTGDVTRHETAGADPHAPLVETLRGRMAAAGLDEVVGTVDDPIERDEALVFGGECRVGNLVADAFLWASGAEVALQNSGGIRSGPPLAGEVTVADCRSVLPFEQPVVTAAVSGAELRAAFEQAAGAGVDFEEEGWWHGHVGGAELVYGADGSLRSATVGGEPLDDDATYTLATSEYVLVTDHEFPALTTDHLVGTHGTGFDVLADYVRELGLEVTVDGRVRRA
jgi:2',3'-cyclic-nucleotide 2'-phosphodiesterase (5'-nucleotidase family)